MKQIVVENVKQGPKIIEVPIPKVGPKDLLIRVVCSPLTGFDKVLGFMGVFPPPYVLGVEASGTVVDAGTEAPKEYVGKNVHIASEVEGSKLGSWQGTWSQYVTANAEDVFVYDQMLTHEEACGLYGNPTTAIGIFNAIKETPGGVLIIPGSTPISRILTNLLKNQGRTVISLARNSEEYMEISKGINSYILDTMHKGFPGALEHLIKVHSISILVDFLANETTMGIFDKMPEKSLHLVCGTLSGDKTISVPVIPLVFSEKAVKGYCHSFDDYPNPKLEVKRQLKIVSDDLAKGGNKFRVPIVKQYLMEDFKKALDEQPLYGQRGRIIINFK
eukprot:TRINITY_DN106851_c1_g1_i1.p1 TRINITY_DN106851_c1_g1~~TRINITY_DN106851_c1_g1_i1.p1  ORF type:complete len:332 (-),score=22.40 TRINITY_DN106851_c1_g1_i1:74-1069(-)